MINTHLYYLLAMILSIAFPLIFSFDKKVNFIQYFKAFITASCIIAALFIAGDMLYTKMGVWGFNSLYHLDFKVLNLPIEEILFFIFIPYACLFIYEALRKYTNIGTLPMQQGLLLVFALIFAVLSFSYSNRLYSAVTFLFTALIMLFLHIKNPSYTAYLMLAFLISLIPFFIVNGFLTGMFTTEPIVWYNNEENLGFRIITIPIEDSSYSFNLISLNIIAFEFFKKKFNQ